MRRILPVGLLAVALFAGSAGAQIPGDESIIDRQPMDVGKDHPGTIRQVGQDLLYPYHYTKYWFDAGVAWPVGTLDDQGLSPGLLLRFNQSFWNDDALTLTGSFGAYFSNYSYFNDAQEDLAFQDPSTTDIQTKYYIAWPLMLDLQVAPTGSGTFKPFISGGPGIVWSHEANITSAVNDGVGSAQDDTLNIGPGGEQGISPYEIDTRTRMNLGWNVKAGAGFRVSGGQRPMWLRLVASGMTYYHHTAPRTMLGFYASFGR